MPLPFVYSSALAVILSWCAVSTLQASEPIAITVIGHKMGTKFTSLKDGSVYTYQPFSDTSSRLAHPAPSLPPTAATLGLRGDVGLSVEVAKSGEVKKVTVTHSTGSPLLDEAARAFVQAIWLYPATGQPTTRQEQVRFHPTRENVAEETESVARMVSEKAVSPPYLMIAHFKEWQGTVQMKLSADLVGRVKRVDVTKSSGHLLLDLEAKYWCMVFWRVPRNTVTDCSITFQLH